MNVTRLWRRIRAAWRMLRQPRRLDAAMQEEMRFHIDMEADRLVRDHGIDPREAHRQASVRFGGLERYKEEVRDARGRRWLDAMAIDTKLGVRMLVRHRGLTLTGGFAMAVAIAVGATSFEVITEMLNPGLPFAEGGRVVSIQLASDVPGRTERRLLHDFAALREQITTLQQLAAFRTVQLNLSSRNGPPEPVRVAEMTASGFAVPRIAPLHGRYLGRADEIEGAPRVVVIGYDAWQSRFGGDPRIVSRAIDLDGAPYTVIGVMPDGFKFPIDHQFWIPLTTDPARHERLQGPELFVFGRLAPDATVERAQAELTAVAQRDAATLPAGQDRLRFVVLPYTYEHLDLTNANLIWALRIVRLLIGALSFVVSINLAVLIYARTITRAGEIAVRSALGASRRRILAQLFIEALALALAGAFLGLLLARAALSRIASLSPANGGVPFWIDFELSAGTVIYSVALAVIAAAIMGVLPGIKAMGTNLNKSLRELHSRTDTRLGSVWTTLVVGQVAVAVAILPMAVYLTWQVVRMEAAGPGFDADAFVVATAVLDDGANVDPTRVRAHQLELVSRLQAEPGVAAVTFSSSVPGFSGDRRIEFERGVPVRRAGALDVNTLDVAVDLFDTYGATILAGRGFSADDLGAARPAIVNRSFVRAFLESRNALGLRFRYTRPGGDTTGQNAWHQIVGVVDDFPGFPPAPGSEGTPAVYHPVAPGGVHPFALSVRFNGSVPDDFTRRFREIGRSVDPGMQLRRIMPLSELYRQLRSFWHHIAWGIGLVTISVLLLSAAGIYAMMSFTVAQRTREIGIRAALGAHPRGLLASIFGRALGQLGLGVLAGSMLSGLLFATVGLGLAQSAALLATVAAVMLIVGLFAAIGPARRSLRMHAVEALR